MSLETQIYAIIADQFAIDPSGLGPNTTADDVDGWDSLNHSRLLMRLERELQRDIPDHLLFELSNVGDLIRVFEESAAHG
ncbi:MAG: acyl carrier protein [Pseudomonadota bacterium]